MADKLYIDETPDEVKNAKVHPIHHPSDNQCSSHAHLPPQGLHLITMSTPNGQKVQILLEELADVYGTEWTTTFINIMTNEQKKEWFLRLDPNGRIPVIVDNTQSPPFTVMETSAELLYLLKFADKEDRFGFKDELERNQCLQWLFFWHGSGAPYQGQVHHFTRAAPEKIECMS
jgi:glutathione S-transferase